MKNLLRLLSGFPLFTAGTLAVSAQIQSLPIGSVSAVVEDTVKRIDRFDIRVCRLTADGDYIAEYLYWTEFNYLVPAEERIPAQLELEMRERLAYAVNKSFASPDPSWAGQKFMAGYGGWLPWDYSPGHLVTQLMFGTDNIFSLITDNQGKLVPPEVAYKVDLTEAVLRGDTHAFVVPSVERAVLEVRDTSGNVVERQDSRDSWPGSGMIYVPDPATRPDLLFLPRDYATSGQPGRVMVWYQNRVYQAFSLRDGALVETVYPAVKLSIAVTPLAEGFRKGGSGSTPSRAIRLSVSGTAGQTVELQYSANLTSPSWNALATLTLGASGHGEYVDADAFAGGATSRLYRAVNR